MHLFLKIQLKVDTSQLTSSETHPFFKISVKNDLSYNLKDPILASKSH